MFNCDDQSCLHMSLRGLFLVNGLVIPKGISNKVVRIYVEFYFTTKDIMRFWLVLLQDLNCQRNIYFNSNFIMST